MSKQINIGWDVWEDFDINGQPRFSILDGKRKGICATIRNGEDEPPASKIALSNAKIICHAVNNHSALVDALKAMVDNFQVLKNHNGRLYQHQMEAMDSAMKALATVENNKPITT